MKETERKRTRNSCAISSSKFYNQDAFEHESINSFKLTTLPRRLPQTKCTSRTSGDINTRFIESIVRGQNEPSHNNYASKHQMAPNYCGQASKLLKCYAHNQNLVTLIIIFLIGLSAPARAQYNDTPSPVSSLVDGGIEQASSGFATHDTNPDAMHSESAAASSPSGTTGQPATCFGGLQTFEKISMSSFENPAGLNGAGNNGGLGSGILVQQDDQALTSECINLCRSQSNCLSFVIDYNKFECKSYATTQQELQQEFASKFQRAAPTSANASDTASGPDGYQQQASSNSASVQQLLPSASSNYFEKICLDGVANRNQFGDVCGPGRLWTIERMVDSFLDGFVEKEVTNVNGKDECSKLCIFETQFVCRSADYDHQARLCRLSKEDRRTQPQAMRYVPNSQRQYLENQCSTPGPSACVYETRKNVGIISMDALKFAQTAQDCQMKCNQETTFNCRSYSFHQQRCFLSGDDSVSLNNNLIKLPIKQGWTFGEKKCLVELCTKGIFSYEKITGFTLRSALSTSIELMMPSAPAQDTMLSAASTQSARNTSSLVSSMMSLMLPVTDSLEAGREESITSLRRARSSSSSNLAITEHCRHNCDLGYLNCPAFTIDYRNNRCQRLDRNSQGRHHELVARDTFAYYEKICLRVPEIMSMCQDKYWIFERVLAHELAPRLYDKSLKFVQSRRDCQEYCLQEKQFACRSALYNDETSDCKLSRYDRRMALLEGAYYKNFNARISYLENNCVRDHNAAGRQQCSYERARDEPAYPTFTERIELVPPNATVIGSSSHSSHSSLLSASYANLPLIDEQPQSGAAGHFRPSNDSQRLGAGYCERLCNDNAKFECHSFGYYASTAQCFLSGDDSVSASEMAATPSSGFVYFERKCRAYGSTEHSVPDAPRAPLTTPPSVSYPTTPVSTTTSSGPTTNVQPPSNIYWTPSSQMPPRTIPSTVTTSRPQQQDNSSEPTDSYKCGLGHSFVYQRIPGFEPIGGYLTLLVKNDEQPGIATECSELCRRALECRAFVVDYASNQCFAMLENSSVGLLSLRQALGKDYFEGFCLSDHLLLAGSNCRQKLWLVDKVVDQAVVGVSHHKLLQNSDRAQCRLACLEERYFWCKSAMFDSSTGDCKLYSIERESVPQMRLFFTKGVDFFENQCQISSNACPFDAIERDQTHITVTKSIQARSTFDCELACNSETTFNCRSYTYLDQYPSLPNLCLLSSDSRATSQRGSVKELAKSLYAERNCYSRRPRIPSVLGLRPPEPSHPLSGVGAPKESAAGDPYAPSVSPNRLLSEHEASGPTEDELLVPALGQANCEPHQFTFERTFGYDFRSAPKERAPIAPTIGIVIGCQQECLRRADRCQAFVIDYALPYQSCFLLATQAGANKKVLVRAPNSAYFEKVCLPRTGLSSLPSSSPSLDLPPTEPLTRSPPHLASNQLAHESLDISPSYSSDPWSPQIVAPLSSQSATSQLPYYLQQQQLAHQYPSRSCPKLWSFERFVNHNFTAFVDKLVEHSPSRAHCETACINEATFACRAATYDYVNKSCRLFRNTRRTVLSQFIDLESPAIGSADSMAANVTQLPDSHPGTAHVLSGGEQDTIQAASSDARRSGARQLVNAPTTAEPLNAARNNIDYLENTCTPEPSSCQYRQVYDQFSAYIDKVIHATSLGDCQRQCDQERLFSCKSVNYDPGTRNCMLVNEDLISLSRGQRNEFLGSSQLLMPKKGTIYSEKGNCEMLSVQCNSQEMLVSVNFDAPFRGRIMAKGNPEQCYLLGDGQTSLQFSIVFGPKCNSRQEGHNTFVNELVIQQHPVIMTESDKTVRVMCAFEAPEQTITLKNPGSRDNKTGIDVMGTPESGRTRHDKQHFSSVVSSKAAPPSVLLRILDQNGRDASMINLGDELTLRIQMQTNEGQQNSALGIFARNLAARSSNGESLLLIDNDGCPIDQQVFPALEVDPRDGKSLQSNFKAFRFPSSGLVNFEVQIRFCPERCQPANCHKGQQQRVRSFGRRRKRRDLSTGRSSGAGRTPILQSGSGAATSQQTDAPKLSSLDSLSTVMKPGKAFEYVRKLFLAPVPAPMGSDGVEPTSDQQQSEVGSGDSGAASVSPVESGSDLPTGGEEFERGNGADNEQTTTYSQPEPTLSSANVAATAHTGAITISDGVSPALVATAPVDDRLMPSMGPALRAAAPHAQANKPPYGQFAGLTDVDLQQAGGESSRPAGHTASSSDFGSASESSRAAIHEEAANGLSNAATMDAHEQPAEPNNWDASIETSSMASQQSDQHMSPALSANGEMPLHFSIHVGEKQDGASLSAANSAVAGQMLVMNSSNVDLDHIVVAGNSISATNQNQLELAVTSPSVKTNKRNASYEQTFDAMPSNSIASQVNVANQEHRQHQQAAASHDCQTETGRSKLKTIVWTGSIVIVLNVCLVVLSLLLYFKRVHLRHATHTIVSSSSDCGTPASSTGLGTSRRSHWPSVILKSKSSLIPTGVDGSTSLNTHEHFFCKLNSKQTEHADFNWPNLSSSCSHSTISSLASAVPSTSMRPTHLRPSLRSAPFDAHSSLRDANFGATNDILRHKTILDVNSIKEPDNNYKASYTNSIANNRHDIRPGRF